VSGFLIGDIRELPEPDREALRRAGLSHYVAVSGSNVALFLLLWWLLLGPLAFGSRRRALFGLAGLALFIVVTRWEPSVLRAAMMAGLILLGRGAGLAIGPWSALGGAVCLLVLVSGELVEDVGFQLSVAATAGVMLGATVFRGRRHRRALTAVVAAASAQLAVAPLLLIHFGFVPVLSPLTNLVAGPVVVAATTLGGIGLLSGFRPLVDLATAAAALVLAIARTAAPWPQAGLLGLLSLLGVVIGSSVRRTRPVVVVGVSIWLLLALGLGSGHHGRPAAVFLDVGQGDSILLLGALGETILIDGGPDPGLLIARLRDYGVDHVDLLVASHHHHDHSAGLPAVVERVPVGRIWYSGHPNPGPELEEILRLAVGAGIPAVVPSPGWSARVGEFSIEVLGPLRRYASPNDQSLVLLVRARGETIALPGDIEAIAQRELGPIPADILKVPHQGAATSDLEWLAASAPQTAVISVGPNDYGHPAPEVIKTLSRIGAAVRRTDQEGDVVLLLGE
jgi:competence protein ComEC